jgi:hypothetical protein
MVRKIFYRSFTLCRIGLVSSTALRYVCAEVATSKSIKAPMLGSSKCDDDIEERN